MNVRKIARNILEIVFPSTRDEARVSGLSSLPADPQYVHTRSGLKVFTLTSYKNRDVRAAIHTLKYHGNKKSIALCRELLTDALTEEVAEKELWDEANVIIVPIPLSKKRLRERGFNQVEKILEDMPGMRSDVLIRTVHREPQTALSGSERIENSAGVFEVAKLDAIQDKHVIVVDDVVTTGATLKDAARALEQTGAQEVLPIALARA